MKRIILLSAIFFASQFCLAQSQDLLRAGAYFERTFYSEAIPLYEKAIKEERTFEIVRNLADAYYYTNDLKNAERWYRFLVKNYPSQINEEYYFRYSHALKASGNYEEAGKISRSRLAENEIADFDRQASILENIASLGNRFEIKNLPLNTEHSDFGAVKFGDRLIYASPAKNSKVYKWNSENYLDLYSIPVQNLAEGEAVPAGFSKTVNTKMHESNAVFTKDGTKMYFTRNNFVKGKKGKDKNKVSHLQIFSADLENGEWTNIRPLPFNSDEFSTEHPALSPDETTLYFASDMPGGFGSF
ncbi:MAG TPA: tetratricopeptide repeat protein, partial [Flavobacterium sp.]|nr:tetratricopeptide repeat protein [Flavobacterium sp.]